MTIDSNASVKEVSLLVSAGKLEQALDACVRLVQQDPNKPLHHCNLGEIFMQQGLLDQAERCFMQALDLNAMSHLGLYGIAKIAAAKEQWEEAIIGYQQLITLQPRFIEKVFQDLRGAQLQKRKWKNASTALKLKGTSPRDLKRTVVKQRIEIDNCDDCCSKLTKENKRLLLQLHQIQEEFETYLSK